MPAKRLKRLHTVNVRVDDETLEALRIASDKQNRSVSNMIATILREWLVERPNNAQS
jgi:predicted HicB family RNase H-like nuclease